MTTLKDGSSPPEKPPVPAAAAPPTTSTPAVTPAGAPTPPAAASTPPVIEPPPRLNSRTILDILERAAWTAVQTIAGLYLTKGVVSLSGTETAILTAIAAALSVIKTIALNTIDAEKKTPITWLEDVAARAGFTFGETLLAALITAAATNLNLSSLKAALAAAAAAAFAVLKGAVAKYVGDPQTAQLPSSPPPS